MNQKRTILVFSFISSPCKLNVFLILGKKINHVNKYVAYFTNLNYFSSLEDFSSSFLAIFSTLTSLVEAVLLFLAARAAFKFLKLTTILLFKSLTEVASMGSYEVIAKSAEFS